MIRMFKCLIFMLLMYSCTKEGDFTKRIDDNASFENSVLLTSGVFNPTDGIFVGGKAEIRIKSDLYFVKLVDFSVTSGPDLKVYLSKNNYPSNFVNLGALEGNKNIYVIPQGVDVSQYTHVLIHCQEYNHLFAIAKLNSL